MRAFVRYTSRGDCGLARRPPTRRRREIEVFRGDIREPARRARSRWPGRDVVFHLGALIADSRTRTVTRASLRRHERRGHAERARGRARARASQRVVHTSTSEVYGTAQTVPIDEEHPLQAQSPYAATKIGADQLALSLPALVRHAGGRSCGRSTPTGRASRARAVIPTIITQALARDAIELGATDPTRDFLFVEDTVARDDALRRAPTASKAR